MARPISYFTRVAAAILSALIVDASNVMGADEPAGAPPPPPGATRPAGQPEATARGRVAGGANTPGGRGNFVAGFNLDDKQRELLREATQKESDELRKLNEKLQAAQKELVQSVIAEKYDEKAVREKAEAVSKIQMEITMLRAKAFATVSPTLKPEQREQLDNSQIAIGMIMGGGGFGGGRASFAAPSGGVRNAADGQPGERGVRRRDAGSGGPGANPEPARRRGGGQDQ